MVSVNKKHHPPSREDEVWRLEGIGKDGAYHKNLSSHGIKNVGDFLLKYHEIGSALLKKVAQQNQNWSYLLLNRSKRRMVSVPLDISWKSIVIEVC